MDEEIFAFAVETTAEVEMLRQAVAYLMVRSLEPLSAAGREAAITAFEEEVSDLPPGNLATPGATHFHEAVAATMPDTVARFAASLRDVLAQMPPRET